MALPSSGALKLSDVNVELGLGSTTQRGLGQASTRTLYGVASGAIRLAADGYGKANEFTFSITSNITDANLRTLALAAGWGGASKVVATVNSGVYVYATSTGNAGLTINGAWPGGVQLVNNGYIIGKGGDGKESWPVVGLAGGPAISLGVNTTITNNSGAYIAGGGGSGGGSDGGNQPGGGGGGAGGGNGGNAGWGGGAGGGPGASGSNGGSGGVPSGKSSYASGDGGGGGRILPGTGGSGGSRPSTNGKGGGAGGGGQCSNVPGNNGGGGGSGGSVGSTATGDYSGGGGGGWGAAGGNAIRGGFAGGAGGKAIELNGYTATQTNSGTIYGTVG